MSIIFSPREYIICFKYIQAKQVDLETLSLARLLRDLMQRSSFCALLRSYERLTCSKSTLEAGVRAGKMLRGQWLETVFLNIKWKPRLSRRQFVQRQPYFFSEKGDQCYGRGWSGYRCYIINTKQFGCSLQVDVPSTCPVNTADVCP